MSEKLLMDLLDELKGIRKVLDDMNTRDAETAEEMRKAREFTTAATMESLKGMGSVTGQEDNPFLTELFKKMALGKEKEEEN